MGGGSDSFAYVGDSDWLATITDRHGTVQKRFTYANGRPLRMEMSIGPSYYQFSWHGDANGPVFKDGNGGGWPNFGAWGDMGGDKFTTQYYNWNGAFGYMHFPANFNINARDMLDIGLYYIHGRWYNQDTGLFFSPDEKGEYTYGSGQDAINWAWFAAGAQCQFLNDMALGAADYEFVPGSNNQCRDYAGKDSFTYGQIIGRGLSNSAGAMELFGGGSLFLGGGAITIGSGGLLGEVSVPAAGVGVAMGGYGTAVLIHNLRQPPIAYAEQSGSSNSPGYSTPSQRRIHILDGDSTGGRHSGKYGDPSSPANLPSKVSNKTYFPRLWSDDDIISAAEEAARLTEGGRQLQTNGRYIHAAVAVVREGITVFVQVITTASNEIWTAYPIVK